MGDRHEFPLWQTALPDPEEQQLQSGRPGTRKGKNVIFWNHPSNWFNWKAKKLTFTSDDLPGSLILSVNAINRLTLWLLHLCMIPDDIKLDRDDRLFYRPKVNPISKNGSSSKYVWRGWLEVGGVDNYFEVSSHRLEGRTYLVFPFSHGLNEFQ